MIKVLFVSMLLALRVMSALCATEVTVYEYGAIQGVIGRISVITLDEDGVIKEVTQYWWRGRGDAPPLESDHEDLKVIRQITVHETQDGLTVRDRKSDVQGDSDVLRRMRLFLPRGFTTTLSRGEYEAVLSDDRTTYTLFDSSGEAVVRTSRSNKSYRFDFVVNGNVHEYDWNGDTLYTFTRTAGGRPVTAVATYEPSEDQITVVLPEEEAPSGYVYKYEVDNACDLLDVQFSQSAALLNYWILSNADGWRLFPLFAISDVGDRTRKCDQSGR